MTTPGGPLKVLVVLPQPPAPEGGAADRCSLGLLSGLRSHGVEVRTLAAHQWFTPSFAAPPSADVEVVEVPQTGGLASRVANLRRPHGELARGVFAARVREAAASVDAVHLEQIEAAACGIGLAQPSVAHLHYRVLFDRDFGPPWQRQFRQVLEFVRAERAAARHHRWLVASSPRVADSLRRLAPHAEVVLAPLTLDSADYRPGPAPDEPVAGLVGTAAWPPTARAIGALFNEIWPEVHRQVPGARLVVAGRGTQAIRPPSGLEVKVLGEVPSAVDVLRGLSVLAYPLPRGSGMKVKVLEALALGLPVVTTAEGAEGIGPSDGVVVCADARAVTSALVAILRDAGEREERSIAARRTFDARLSPGPATEPLVELYSRMV